MIINEIGFKRKSEIMDGMLIETFIGIIGDDAFLLPKHSTAGIRTHPPPPV